MLPIEYACMLGLPAEVVLSLVLVDLPFELDEGKQATSREGFGLSWWFLTCESDDHYADVVQQVISMCSHEQVKELCFLKGGPPNRQRSVMSHATPRCRQLLTAALRFVGRFEFIGSSAIASDPTTGLKIFDALDFGAGDQNDEEDGKRVRLSCYAQEEPFRQKTSALSTAELNHEFIEEVLVFVLNEGSSHVPARQAQYCLSVEQPGLTLDGVVSGMMKNSAYQQDTDLRKKYSAKVAAVLRLVAKSLRHLHSMNVIHGAVELQQCGKFNTGWKLMGRLDVQEVGSGYQYMGGSMVPPEAVCEETAGDIIDADAIPICISQKVLADPSIDIWGFGKLAYEVLVGKDLVEFKDARHPADDVVALLDIMEWNEDNIRVAFEDLLDIGIPESGAELIASCLMPTPEARPSSMDEILSSPFWKEMKKHRRSAKLRAKLPSEALLSVGDE